MPHILRDLVAIVFVFAFHFVSPLAVSAAEATGEWLIEDGDARVRIAPCGADLCGNVAWIKEGSPTVDVNNPDPAKRSRPLLGSAVLLGLKPSGASEWTGSALRCGERAHLCRQAHHSSMSVTSRSRDAFSAGLICESQTWTRTR